MKTDDVDFGESYISMTVHAWLKENVDHYVLVAAKRSQMLWSALTA